jgi:hypothetical protein
MMRNKYFYEKITKYSNYRDNKSINQVVYFGHGGAGKLSDFKLFKKFKNYADKCNRTFEVFYNINGKDYHKAMSGYINKLYTISEHQFLIKNKKIKFSEFYEEN